MNLVVAGVSIRQDAEGRYCLNDLHKAAGGDDKSRSSFWLRRKETHELINTLIHEGTHANIVNCANLHSLIGDDLFYKPVVTVEGRNGGTYVCKELVYAYAMWISPTFHLKVIRAYDDLQTNGVAFSERAVNQVASGEMSEDELIAKAVSVLDARVKRLQDERNGLVNTIGKYTHTINRVVRMFDGVNTNATKGDLCRLGYLYRSKGGSYRVYRKFSNLFIEKFDETTGHGNIFCTPEGKAELSRLYSQGKLTLKLNHKGAHA